jgi:hypothetical protein
MKRLLFPLIAILLLTSGCFYITNPFPSENQGTTNTATGQPPTAYIDSITPQTPTPGQTITFTGHGTDPDGQVVGFKWRSSLNGNLSNLASFQTASLTPGTQTIYFSVQDNKGNWSIEVADTLAIAAAPTTPPPTINSFYGNPGAVLSGNSAVLSWNVSNATSILIDQGIGPVSSTGTIAVTPFASTIYMLTATNSVGSVMAATQVTIISSMLPNMPVINSFLASPPVVVKGSSTTLSWNVSNADTVQIDQGIGTIAANGVEAVTPATSTAYTLKAVNATGWVSQTIVVSVFTFYPGINPEIQYQQINPDMFTPTIIIPNP